MNSLPVAIALDPEPLDGPFCHMVVTEQNTGHRLWFRHACICGHRSDWFRDSTCEVDHPHGQVTVSRSDLTVIPHPSNLRVVR